MTQFLFTLALAALAAGVYLFYDKFTKRGAIPLDKAFKDFTAYLGYAAILLADYIISLANWAVGLWDPLQQQFGEALAAPGLAKLTQVAGFIVLALKFKNQTPPPVLNIPKPGDPLP